MNKHQNGLYDPITRRRFLQMLGGSAAALTLAACGQQPSLPATQQSTPTAREDAEEPENTPMVAAEPQRGGTLRIAFSGAASVLDPSTTISVEDIFAAWVMHERLVQMDENMDIQPVLATEWEESEDGMSWTFKLREGVTFHNGKPFGVEDVVYTFERILNPDVGATALRLLNFVTAVEAVDEQTVRFDLQRPSAEFLILLSFYNASIIQRDRDDESLRNEPIGTGAFQFTEFLPGERLRMTRNENYWQPDLPYLDEVQHVYMTEANARMEALNSGVVDMVWNLEIEQIPVVEANNDLQVINSFEMNSQPIILNMNHSPLDDVRIREALKLCVDREGMMQVATQGRGTIANDQPVYVWHPLHADIPPREQAIDQAKALLAEAGYADGLTLTMATSSIRSGMHESAIAFQEMAQQAGVTIELEKLPAETYWGEFFKYPMSVSNMVGFPAALDANLTLFFHSKGSWNDPGYQNAELDSLIEQVLVERDTQKRADIYKQIQQIISEDGAWIIPYQRSIFVASRATVQKVVMPIDGLFHVTDVWKEQEG
jgi:peptide/nickel transport system substrate-binding protein